MNKNPNYFIHTGGTVNVADYLWIIRPKFFTIRKVNIDVEQRNISVYRHVSFR